MNPTLRLLSAVLLAGTATTVAFAQNAGPVSTTAATGIGNSGAVAPAVGVGSGPANAIGTPPSVGSPVVPSGVGNAGAGVGPLPSTLASPNGTLQQPGTLSNATPGQIAAQRSYADPGRAAGPLAVPDSLSAGGDLCPANLIRTAGGCVPPGSAKASGNLLNKSR